MTRFDATTPDGRRELVADTIVAHRERASSFCTLEAHEAPPGAELEIPATEGEEEIPEEPQAAPAWVQFSVTDAQLNLDCTDEEYDRITDVLSTASAFTVADQASPEDAEGRNLRVTARTDPERIAEIVDRIFVEGFQYPEDYRLWTTEI